MPLFSDEERHIVGLLYAQEGRDAAVKKGLEFVGPKLSTFIDVAESLSPERRVLMYCWRGGMRRQAETRGRGKLYRIVP